MTAFRFTPVTHHPILRPYVAKISVFESSGRLPALERKLIVPNANFKLTLTYRNGIMASIGDKTFIQGENQLSLTGLVDSPVMIDAQDDTETGTIIIEFNPLGAYRFFNLSYTEVKNQIIELSDLIGYRAEELQYQLAEVNSVTQKLHILQTFLIAQLQKTVADPIYDYCIGQILCSDGLLTVAQLEKKTGYSSRWLHRKFLNHLGTGPKNLAEIIRFKQFYHAYSTGTDLTRLKDQIYKNYYDQSHFLRAFKRFTGSTPTDLQNSTNELSTRNFIT